jgi:hypothetical protein
MADKVTVANYAAYGGPEVAFMADDGHMAGPTDEGEYRVHHCARHSSKRYPDWSKIPWGAKVRDDGEKVSVFFEGKWRSLSDVVPLGRKDVLKYHDILYKVAKVPDRWVFNDFGHVTCYLYKDTNANVAWTAKNAFTVSSCIRLQ